MTENERKEVEILASELFHIHHKHNLTFKNCSSELREWYLLEADWLIKKGYSKRPQHNNEFGHSGDKTVSSYPEDNQQPPKERKVSLKEIKIIKSVLDYYNLTEDGFYTDVISEEIAKRLNAVLDGKEGGVNGTKI